MGYLYIWGLILSKQVVIKPASISIYLYQHDKNIFTRKFWNEIISRITNLRLKLSLCGEKWMLHKCFAHCCVTYEMIYDDIILKPSAFMKFILKALVKKTVVTDVPYKKKAEQPHSF